MIYHKKLLICNRSLIRVSANRAQSESAGPKHSWGQAVATLGRPHNQDVFSSATAKYILIVGPPQCSYGLAPTKVLDLRIHSERGYR